MESIWKIRPSIVPPAELLEYVGQNTAIACYLMQRGITSPEQAARYLKPDRNNLTDPLLLTDMSTAVDRVSYALNKHEKIGIWGDFDVDGQTATAVLVESLQKLGADVVFYLPIRGKESHGINVSSLQNFLKQGIRLLITCDTGISEAEAIQYAADNGVDVIITDHHTLPDVLPPALACVNPRRMPEDHPLSSLSGSGVAVELMLAICRGSGKEEIAFESIDLAAIGLIADLAPLKQDSRLIAQLGLKRLGENPRQCIRALIETAKLKNPTMDEQLIGYFLAPRLNAAGRLEDANPLVPFLMDQGSSDERKALADRLEGMNANRKWLCDQVFHAAVEQLDRQKELSDAPVIILSHSSWPGGVLGLAAGQISGKFNRPAILLNESTDGLMRGSARSIEGINITEAIASAGDLLAGFGGHPMAAGLSLKKENLSEFKHRLYQSVLLQGFDVSVRPVLEIDAELSLCQITHEFYSTVKQLAPFGKENPPLAFCSPRVHIVSSKPLGVNREHFKLIIEDETGQTIPVVWWNADEDEIPEGWFDFAYYLNENIYKGEVTLQAVWLESHELEESPLVDVSGKNITVFDFRSSPNPLEAALQTCGSSEYVIFYEPRIPDREETVGRYHLHPVDTLILASLPTSQKDIEDIIQKSQPRKVMLAMEKPGNKTNSSYLQTIAGLIRYAVSARNGLANLKELAEASNSREESVMTALTRWEASGNIQIQSFENDLLQFTRENRAEDTVKKREAELRLEYELREITSFQKHIYALSKDEFTELLQSLHGKPTRRQI